MDVDKVEDCGIAGRESYESLSLVGIGKGYGK